MFEYFTKQARSVTVLAQEEARILNHDYISTVHLLLGLIHEQDGLASKVLVANGMTLADSLREVPKLTLPVANGQFHHIPFTPRARKVLEFSLRESLRLGVSYIDTEHLLLGMLRVGRNDEHTSSNRIMALMNVDPAVVHADLIRALTGYAAGQPIQQDEIPDALMRLRLERGQQSEDYLHTVADILEPYLGRRFDASG